MARTGQGTKQALAALNTTLTSEEDGSQRLSPIFDKDKVAKDIGAQVHIGKEFGKVAPKAIADYANRKQKEAALKAGLAERGEGQFEGKSAAQWQQEAQRWGEGGAWRVLLHGAVGGLTGGMEGAIGAGASAIAAPTLNQMQDSLQERLMAGGMGEQSAKQVAQGTTGLIGTGLGWAAAGGNPAGAAGALNKDFNNRQLTPQETTALLELRKGKTLEEQKRLTAAACALARCADGVPPTDPYYVALKAMQSEGEQYAHEQSLLKATGKFKDYGVADSLIDKLTAKQVGTRLEGALQFGTGALQVGAGAATIGTGVASCGPTSGAGCLLIVAGGISAGTGADNSRAGLDKMLSGEQSHTLGALIIHQVTGLSPEKAELLYGLGSAGSSVASAYKANKAMGVAKTIKTGTVFDSIKPTQPVYPGSVIPKSFEMALPNGQKIWVAGNATEHIAEFAK